MPKTKTIEDQLRDAMEIIRQKETKLQVAEAQIKAIQRDNDSADKVRREIWGLKELTPTVPRWFLEPPKKGATGVPVTIWSDWHFGERVSLAETGGVNEFDLTIAQTRVQRLVGKIIDLAFHHTVNPQYPGLVVCLGGDMITGSIHEELAETNGCTTQQACLVLQESLIWAFEMLLTRFKQIYVPCVVGNHGRGTRKPRFKNTVFHSYEWNVYNQLELYFKKDKRIVFHIPDETDAHFKVYGHRFTLTHGDNLGVAGGDGIIGAIGPIARGASKVGRSEAQIGRDFDTLLMGHWHTYIPRGDATPVVVNGCLIGYNEYARLKLRVPYSRPSQALFFVNPSHGITHSWPIFLEDKKQALDSAEWVMWQQKRG